MVVITEPIEEELLELDEVDQLLIDTEQYIRDHGWTREQYLSDDGQVCTLGGMRKVRFGTIRNDSFRPVIQDRVYMAASFRIKRELMQRYPDIENIDVVLFNDEIAESVEDVYNLLRAARIGR